MILYCATGIKFSFLSDSLYPLFMANRCSINNYYVKQNSYYIFGDHMPADVTAQPTVAPTAPGTQVKGVELSKGGMREGENVIKLPVRVIINLFNMAEEAAGTASEIYEWIKVFRNASKDSLRKKGINIEDIGRKLGQGTYGSAYIYRGDVLKMTADISEAATAASLINQDIDGVAKIFKVLIFPKDYGNTDVINPPNKTKVELIPSPPPEKAAFKHPPSIPQNIVMAWIIQERLYPLSAQMRDKIEEITLPEEWKYQDKMKRFGSIIGVYMREQNTEEALRLKNGIMNKLSQKYGVTEPWKGFWELMDSLKSKGIVWYDIHADNILEDIHGNLKIIDMGISKTSGGGTTVTMKLDHMIKLLRQDGVL